MIATVRSPEPIAPFPDSKLSTASRFAGTNDEPAIATQFCVYESVREIDPAEWNSVRTPGNDPFMELGFIEAIEKNDESAGSIELLEESKIIIQYP